MERDTKFLADVMLGSLARWLRILGYDTAHDNRIEDDEIIERCRIPLLGVSLHKYGDVC